MTGRALEWLARSMRALPMSLLTGTVTRKIVAAQ